MKKICFISLCLAALISVSGCSGSKGSSSGTEPSSAVPASTETAGVTEPTSEDREYVTNGDEGELTDKEVIDLLEKTVQAGIDRDFESFARYSDMDISHYLSTGKWITGEEYLTFLSNDPGITAYFTMYDQFKDMNVSFVNPERISSEELEKINSYIVKIGEQVDVERQTPLSEVAFEDGYKAYMRYNDQPEDDLTARMYVLKLRGEWKTDAYITFVMEMYGEFSDEQ